MCQNGGVAEFLVAFAAGLISFASPCVLPVLPGYVGYLAGAGPNRAPVRAALFVLGFGAVFVALGAAAGTLGRLLATYQVFLREIGGIAVIVFGLQMMGVLGGFAGAARAPRTGGALQPLVAGGAFAFGFSPCIGPALASLLVLAGQAATAGRGAGLLAAYSAGLGLPLLAVAFGLGGVQKLLGRIPAVEQVGGALLIAVGLVLYFGGFARLGGVFG